MDKTHEAVASTDELGRVVPERAAFDRWQADSAPELWENNRASLGGTAWEAWRARGEYEGRKRELVGWQQRWVDPEEGPSLWAFVDGATADLLRGKKHYEVRPVFAVLI